MRKFLISLMRHDFTDLIDVNNEQTSDTLIEVNSNTAESMSEPQEIQDTQSQQLEPLRRS